MKRTMLIPVRQTGGLATKLLPGRPFFGLRRMGSDIYEVRLEASKTHPRQHGWA